MSFEHLNQVSLAQSVDLVQHEAEKHGIRADWETEVVPRLKVAQLSAEEIEKIGPKMHEKLQLLEGATPTLEDVGTIVSYLTRLQSFYGSSEKEGGLNEEMHLVALAVVGSDVGKAGPRYLPDTYPLSAGQVKEDAILELSLLIARLYGIKTQGIGAQDIGRHEASIYGKDHADVYAKLDAFLRVELARHKGVQKDGPLMMRDLYDLHVFWSRDILADSGFDPRAQRAAILHHILEGNYPRDIVNEKGQYVKDGELTGECMGRVELLTLLLDKYDARMTRGETSHAEAIAWLKSFNDRPCVANLDPHVRALFMQLIDDMDHALA